MKQIMRNTADENENRVTILDHTKGLEDLEFEDHTVHMAPKKEDIKKRTDILIHKQLKQ